VDQKLSVFHLFSELFPEYANDKDRDGGNTGVSVRPHNFVSLSRLCWTCNTSVLIERGVGRQKWAHAFTIQQDWV